jgi:hypothetical protein
VKSTLLLAIPLAMLLSGCGSYSTSSVKPATGAAQGASASAGAMKTPADILLTEGDITDRPYTVLGDVSVTVRKVTIFDSDPTKEKVGEALKEKAAKMGADAVVLARYGTVGIGFTSWGVMDGNGRAVVFQGK